MWGQQPHPCCCHSNGRCFNSTRSALSSSTSPSDDRKFQLLTQRLTALQPGPLPASGLSGSGLLLGFYITLPSRLLGFGRVEGRGGWLDPGLVLNCDLRGSVSVWTARGGRHAPPAGCWSTSSPSALLYRPFLSRLLFVCYETDCSSSTPPPSISPLPPRPCRSTKHPFSPVWSSQRPAALIGQSPDRASSQVWWHGCSSPRLWRKQQLQPLKSALIFSALMSVADEYVRPCLRSPTEKIFFKFLLQPVIGCYISHIAMATAGKHFLKTIAPLQRFTIFRVATDPKKS